MRDVSIILEVKPPGIFGLSRCSSSSSGFVDKTACLVGEKFVAHHTRLTNVLFSVSDRLEFHFQGIVELSRASEEGGRVSTANQEKSGLIYSRLLDSGYDFYASQSCVLAVHESCLQPLEIHTFCKGPVFPLSLL